MKTVLITGVGRGIGKALAEKFLAEGFFVVGTVREGTVPIRHEHLTTFVMDLSVPESIVRCVSEMGKLERRYDVLINNAGVLIDDEETVVVIEKLRKTLEVNLIGAIDFTERLIPFINQSGHIVNISSEAGSLESTGQPSGHHPYRYPAYRISKAALNMYTRVLALRMKHEGREIAVSSVHPGWVRTEMGGEDADISPEEAALGIFEIALEKPESGGFWFGNENVPW